MLSVMRYEELPKELKEIYQHDKEYFGEDLFYIVVTSPNSRKIIFHEGESYLENPFIKTTRAFMEIIFRAYNFGLQNSTK